MRTVVGSGTNWPVGRVRIGTRWADLWLGTIVLAARLGDPLKERIGRSSVKVQKEDVSESRARDG